MKKIFFFLVLIPIFGNLSSQTWQEAFLAGAADAEQYKNFGISVAIDSTYAAVGAYLEDTDQNGNNPMQDAGAVYIFKIVDGFWQQIKKITPSDRAVGDRFGEIISISKGKLIVGAYNKVYAASTLNNAGCAYIFENDKGGPDGWGEVQKLISSDIAATDFFGFSVDISGDRAIVGAYYEDEDQAGLNTLAVAGSAYIFVRVGSGNWIEQRKIVASDRFNNDWFGYSVAISDTIAVVGAVHEEHDKNGTNLIADAGSAYIFYQNQGGLNNWGQVTKITASDRNENGYFGSVADISGDDIIIGTVQINSGKAGSAYLFNRNAGGMNNWGEMKKFIASNSAINDNFGSAVSISGDYLLIGATHEDHIGKQQFLMDDAGSAYLFSRNTGGINTWGELQKFTASDGEPYAEFGTSVAVFQKNIIVGSDRKLYNTGSAYIYMNSPAITIQPLDLGVCSGRDTSISITSPEAIKYTWQIKYKTSTEYVTIVDDANFANSTTSKLSIKTINLQTDSAHIRCIAGGMGVSTASREALIKVFPPPAVEALADRIRVCAEDQTPVILSGKGADKYEWDNNVKNGVSFIPDITKKYTVFGIDFNTCTATDTVTVFVDNRIIAEAGKDTTINVSEYVLNADNPAPGTGYWFAPDTSVVFENKEYYKSRVSGLIEVNQLEWTVTNGACSSNDYVLIKVVPNSGVESFENEIVIYPNPTKNFIVIKFIENTEIKNLEITDISGKRIFYKQYNSFFSEIELNLSDFEKTKIMFLKVQTQNSIIQKKLVLE